MPDFRILHVLVLVSLCGLAGCNDSSSSDSGGTSGGSAQGGEPRLLVFSRTAGFRHASIETGVETVRQLGAEHGFAVDPTEDPAAFTPENLARYTAVMWLSTTGIVLDADQKAAFEGYIARGGGYVGVHSASDSEYDWPFYGELVGAYFKNHPVFPLYAEGGPGVQAGDFHVEAAEHPSTAHLPRPWRVSDEFYSFKRNPRGSVRVLLNIDEGSYDQDPNTSNAFGPNEPFGETGVMNDHPMSWCHDNLGGRAWYTALGHSVAIYAIPEYRQHLLNGILTAMRRVPADCVPREEGPLAEPAQGPAVPQQIPGLAEVLRPLLAGAGP